MKLLLNSDDIDEFLSAQMKAWSTIGGGANLQAFPFDQQIQQSPEKLEELGYTQNPDAWEAGVQMKNILLFAQKHKIQLSWRF